MNNIEILAKALEYIEAHLKDDIKTEDVAKACFCSKSALEKIFRWFRISVHDYVIRRRMTLAAKDIALNPNKNLIDVALSCGYSTNESFSRTFKNVWNCNPSEFRGNPQFSELFPRLYPPLQDGGSYIMMRRNVDISELYELFRQRKDCYFVCADIRSLMPINEISRKAGDIAIIETMNRLEKEAGDEDIVFRIGGDEFVILTNSEDIEYAQDLGERIRMYNEKTFEFDKKEIPLSLHLAVVKYEGGNIRYKNLFEQLHNAIIDNKY